jgi:hypothetical protein
MNTTLQSSNMYSVKVFINMGSVEAVILVWDIMELMSFLHHNSRSLHKRQSPITYGLQGSMHEVALYAKASLSMQSMDLGSKIYAYHR